jgi:hypothetical protein
LAACILGLERPHAATASAIRGVARSATGRVIGQRFTPLGVGMYFSARPSLYCGWPSPCRRVVGSARISSRSINSRHSMRSLLSARTEPVPS